MKMNVLALIAIGLLLSVKDELEAQINEDIVMFRGVPGNNVDPFEAWINGTSVTTDIGICSTLINNPSCTQHYRLKDLDINDFCEIRYALYKGYGEAAYLTFRANGTNYFDWFAKENIIPEKTFWTDMLNSNYTYFSLEGYAVFRRRFMTFTVFGACDIDRGYTVALMQPFCDWENFDSYPQFLFSSAKTETTYSQGSEKADFVAIIGKRCS